MNKIILTTLVSVLCFSFNNAQLGLINSENDINPNNYKTDVLPYYTSVENLFDVEMGMTYNQVRRVLDVEPYSILNNMKGSGMIVEFKYMQKGKKVLKSKDTYYINTFDQSNTHYHDAKSVYMVFDENKVLKSYYTDAGTKLSAEVLTWENTLNIMLNDPNYDCANCTPEGPSSNKNGEECNSNKDGENGLKINLKLKKKKK